MSGIFMFLSQHVWPTYLALIISYLLFQMAKHSEFIALTPKSKNVLSVALLSVVVIVPSVNFSAYCYANYRGPVFIFPLLPLVAYVLIGPFMLLSKIYGQESWPPNETGTSRHNENGGKPKDVSRTANNSLKVDGPDGPQP